MTVPWGRSKSPRVLWTRGRGCQELAELLGGADAARVAGEPARACIEHRADLLVVRRLAGFDLVDSVVPVDLDPEGVESVVATVAGGPHSTLAAMVADRIGTALGVPASMVSAYPRGGEAVEAAQVVEEIYPQVPDIAYSTVEATDMADLVSNLPERALLVFGAPGGSWFQRRLSGPGARLRSRAQAGAIMVKAAPRRVFQDMGEPVFVAPFLQVADTLRIRPESTLAVAEAGRLVGLVRRARLLELAANSPVGEVMEEPLSIGHAEPVSAAQPLRPVFGVDPIPVTDEEEFLVGGLAPPAA